MILKKFALMHPSICEQEAKVYLDDAGWCFEEACEAVRDDEEWEKSKLGELAGRKNEKFNANMDKAEGFLNWGRGDVEEGVWGIVMGGVGGRGETKKNK